MYHHGPRMPPQRGCRVGDPVCHPSAVAAQGTPYATPPRLPRRGPRMPPQRGCRAGDPVCHPSAVAAPGTPASDGVTRATVFAEP